MRISDWSSDVCSSDLDACWLLDQFGPTDCVLRVESIDAAAVVFAGTLVACRGICVDTVVRAGARIVSGAGVRAGGSIVAGDSIEAQGSLISDGAIRAGGDIQAGWGISAGRSEEHTSELQSLMRISYAVFCLK